VTRSTRWFLPLAGGAVLVYFLSAVPEERAAAKPPGSAAPAFVLPDLQGNPVALDSFRGRPTLLNFWATWCPPCRAEMPDLQSLADGREDCLNVVGIAIGSGDAAEVGAFVRERGLRYPMLLGNDQIGADYEIRTIPRSVLLDSSGNEAAHWDGPIDRKAVRAAVHALGPAPVRC
jgi:thiol-disulfide isomerase/thioredoxin